MKDTSGRPRNPSEAAFWDFAQSQGWKITKRGWPDFACFQKDDNLILVEVKPKRSRNLKTWQAKLMIALGARGIGCFRWDPVTGFTQVVPSTAFPHPIGPSFLKQARDPFLDPTINLDT